MAVNKNAQIRYKALDSCFSNTYKRFYINDLIEHCSKVLSDHYAKETTVSRRQIFDDIDFMKSEAGFDAPIESYKDGRRAYYKYSDSTFSILKAPLNPSELDSLKEAIETLSRMNNMAGFEWVRTIQTKLQENINRPSNTRQIISFEENQFLEGLEFLNDLYQYSINKQVLKIAYRGFKSGYLDSFLISPQYLKQYNNRWFLFGINHSYGTIQNLALDRIQNIELDASKFIDSDIDFTEYFEDIIGVSNNLDEQPVEVVIKLSDNIIPYIKSKPIHGSQKIKDNILTIEVKLNYELNSLILSFGDNMQVLHPKILAESIRVIINNTAKLYYY